MKNVLRNLLAAGVLLGASTHAFASDPADPTTKTLPAKASDTAKANAFGQMGAKQRAAHQAAQAAAHAAAKAAAQSAAAQVTLPPQATAGQGNAAAGLANKPASPGLQGKIGLDTAASHGAPYSPTSHPGRP
jgi:hypothetical protein